MTDYSIWGVLKVEEGRNYPNYLGFFNSRETARDFLRDYRSNLENINSKTANFQIRKFISDKNSR